MGCMDFQPEVRAKGGGEVAFFFLVQGEESSLSVLNNPMVAALGSQQTLECVLPLETV